jgi:hypothetical protein
MPVRDMIYCLFKTQFLTIFAHVQIFTFIFFLEKKKKKNPKASKLGNHITSKQNGKKLYLMPVYIPCKALEATY